MNKKIIISILAVVFTFSIVGLASAVILEELQAQFNDLLVKYNLLLTQVGQSVTTTGYCLFSDLKLGMTSAEVTALQQGLKQNPVVYPEGLVTGYFGPLTKAAVIRFQNNFATEILSPWGLTKGTGFVGSTTRTKLNAMYCTPRITPSQCTDGSSCGWCGDQCEKVTSGVSCPDVMPPTGVSCVCENNTCTIPSTTTTTTSPIPTTTTTRPTTLPPCQWCGMACMRVESWMACMQILPPQGYSCCEVNGQCTGVIGICKPSIPTPTTTTTIPPTTTTTTVPIARYTCNPSTWQCVLTYGGGQYDSLSLCQAICQPPTTTTTIPPTYPCAWCGSACVRLAPGMYCPQITPPIGYSCCEVNGQCTAVRSFICLP